MATLQALQKLSDWHCVLLAVEYAIESNITALQCLAAFRERTLPLELILRILLTYLPEELDPSSYVDWLNELATETRTPGSNPAALDLTAVKELSISRAKKRQQQLEFLPVTHPLFIAEEEFDIFSQFLIHRSHRIDSQTGLLDLVPSLVVPFLSHSEGLRTWFISTILPLLRLSYEYYSQSPAFSLDEFTQLKGKRAIDTLLSHTVRSKDVDGSYIARDMREIVAPWLCGASGRKRRRIISEGRRAPIGQEDSKGSGDWNCLFQWLLHSSKQHLKLVTTAISEWDGPEDMDLGGFNEGRDYVEDEQQSRLEVEYAQTAFACPYLVEQKDLETLRVAHKLLRRLCELLSYDHPPNLDADIHTLPRHRIDTLRLKSISVSSLQEERLLEKDNAITKPSQDNAQILEQIIFSALVLSSFKQRFSIREVAKIILRRDHTEQLSLLGGTLHTLESESRLSNDQWLMIRVKLLWLRDWGLKELKANEASGVFGMIKSSKLEAEILKALLESSRYSLAVQIYIQAEHDQSPLKIKEVEDVVLNSAMEQFDSASNGNKTRGGMRRAVEIVAAFAPHFPSLSRFQRMQALFTATHAMSFYSLILQHGVPFQPVNVRVASNPLSLIKKLLSQNSGSYTKLDDLISIGQNFMVAMPATIMEDDSNIPPLDALALEQRKTIAERRVIAMAIEAALREDDFETAYSYVVNRLHPEISSPTHSVSSRPHSYDYIDISNHDDKAEDIAWQAALCAGRHDSSQSVSKSWTKAGKTPQPDIRRLEQRMELLSQALLLAPPPHLEEVLGVWLKCEAEMTHLLAQEKAAEERFNDAADRKLPGAFDFEPVDVQPVRWEIGRGAGEEAPIGLFDLARGAGAALSRSAFPLRGAPHGASQSDTRENTASRVIMDLSDSGSQLERGRKRDMVASAASGALASGSGALVSGLGWVLGAKPVNEPR